eukprot:1777326-Rhodomonas_salina.1
MTHETLDPRLTVHGSRFTVHGSRHEAGLGFDQAGLTTGHTGVHRVGGHGAGATDGLEATRQNQIQAAAISVQFVPGLQLFVFDRAPASVPGAPRRRKLSPLAAESSQHLTWKVDESEGE